jgi:hypothetical protein
LSGKGLIDRLSTKESGLPLFTSKPAQKKLRYTDLREHEKIGFSTLSKTA